MAAARPTASEALLEFLGSAPFASTLATVGVGVGVLALPLHNTIGWAGLIAIIAALVVLCTASVWARRDTLDRTGLLPISLLAFSAWAGLSVVWSQYQWVTIGSLAYLFAFSLLGVYIALVRDVIQVIRVFGDVIRFVLVVSLALEVLSGLLIDSPIRFLGIDGNLAEAGPISGLMANRNDLGLLAVIGGLSFIIEWRTRSIQRGLAIGSLVLAAITLLFTRSSIGFGTAFVAVVVLGVLYGIRRVPAPQRRFWQVGVLVLAVVGAIAAWVLRAPIIGALNATGELNYRLSLWNEIWALLRLHIVEGWGWVGQWNTSVVPYSLLETVAGRPSNSAVNAYLDVWFQLGFIGFALFLGFAGLAFARSWLLASRQRSVVYTWPAVVLASLLTASLAESGILTEFGWMTLVICCVLASQKLSWRSAFRRPLEQEPL
jgi:O-antigen ligase